MTNWKKKFQGAFSIFLCGISTQTLRVRPKLGLRLGLNLIQTVQNKVLRPKTIPWDAYANRLIHCVKETLRVVYIICQEFHGDFDNPWWHMFLTFESFKIQIRQIPRKPNIMTRLKAHACRNALFLLEFQFFQKYVQGIVKSPGYSTRKRLLEAKTAHRNAIKEYNKKIVNC